MKTQMRIHVKHYGLFLQETLFLSMVALPQMSYGDTKVDARLSYEKGWYRFLYDHAIDRSKREKIQAINAKYPLNKVKPNISSVKEYLK